jgi:diketogulonate reductase-like aldo/keto reductase
MPSRYVDERFWNLPTKATQIDCILVCRATKATQIDCTLFYYTAKIFEICQQKQLRLTAFCSAAQQVTLGFAKKSNSN